MWGLLLRGGKKGGRGKERGPTYKGKDGRGTGGKNGRREGTERQGEGNSPKVKVSRINTSHTPCLDRMYDICPPSGHVRPRISEFIVSSTHAHRRVNIRTRGVNKRKCTAAELVTN